MATQIRDIVQRCDICCAASRAQPKEELLPTLIPDYPWDMIGADLCQVGSENFLVLVDYFSGFWEIDPLTEVTTTGVIRIMRRQFARYGIPVRVVSDNGPQFASQAFRTFASEWGIMHVTSSPGHPSANGKVESAIKTAKGLIQKAKADG